MQKIVKGSNRGSAPGERRGGRKKGVPNKKTAAVIEAVESSGIKPTKRNVLIPFLSTSTFDGSNHNTLSKMLLQIRIKE